MMPLARQTYMTAWLVALVAMLVVWGRYPLKWWSGRSLPDEAMLLAWASIYAEPVPISLSAWEYLVLPEWAYAVISAAFALLLLRRSLRLARHGLIPAIAYEGCAWFLAIPVWVIWLAGAYIGITVILSDGTYDALAGLIVATSGMLLAPVLFIFEVSSLRRADRF